MVKEADINLDEKDDCFVLYTSYEINFSP